MSDQIYMFVDIHRVPEMTISAPSIMSRQYQLLRAFEQGKALLVPLNGVKSTAMRNRWTGSTGAALWRQGFKVNCAVTTDKTALMVWLTRA